MRPIYATRLTVFVAPGRQNEHDRLAALARAQIEREAGPQAWHGAGAWACPPPLRPDEQGRFAGPGGHCHGEFAVARADGARSWRGVVTRPVAVAAGIPRGLLLRTEAQVRSSGQKSVVTTRQLLGAADGGAVPHGLSVPSPTLTAEVLAAGIAAEAAVIAGRLLLGPGATSVGEADVGDELVQHAKAPSRAIPLVVVSRTPDERVLVDPDALARALVGLAQVVVLRDFATAFRLTEQMSGGKEWSAFLGAVRVYEPGLDVDTQSPFQHRLFLPQELEQGGGAGRLPELLRVEFAERSAAAIGPDADATAVEQAAARAEEAARAEATTRALAAMRGTPETEGAEAAADVGTGALEAALERERAAWERHRQEAAVRIRELEVELAGAGQRTEEYRALLAVADEEAKELGQHVADLEATVVHLCQGGQARHRGPEADEPTFASLETMLAHAARHWHPDAVVFHARAHRSARNHGFNGSLEAAVNLLWAVCEVAGDYHGAQEMPGGFPGAFAEAGEPGFRRASSTTAVTMYRDDYELRYDHGDGRGSVRVQMGPHVGLGSGTGNASLKVYWYVDEVNRKFVVGHVGDHLPIPSYR